MKRLVLLVAAPLALMACGNSSTFTLSSGSYAPSAATATAAFPADNCNVVDLFSTGQPPFNVSVAADGKSANFFFSSITDAQHTTSVAIDGNAISGATAANYSTVVGSLCTFSTKVTVVSGELTAKDDMHLVVQYELTPAVGAICTLADMDVKTSPCTSQVDFLAKK